MIGLPYLLYSSLARFDNLYSLYNNSLLVLGKKYTVKQNFRRIFMTHLQLNKTNGTCQIFYRKMKIKIFSMEYSACLNSGQGSFSWKNGLI